MGLFSRKPSAGATGGDQRSAKEETISHFRDFVRSHAGCEAFIEPPTHSTQTTMVIVADTGEWTRRRVPDLKAARRLAQDLGVVAFDVLLSGYPSRMREWNERQRKR